MMCSTSQYAEEKHRIIVPLQKKMLRDHVGAHNAVVTKVLSDLLKVHPRAVRLAMHDILRIKRCPVISYEGTETLAGYQGWFVAVKEKEVQLYIQTLQKKIQPLQRRILVITEVFHEYTK